MPLRGVLHSAAVIDDGLVTALSRESLETRVGAEGRPARLRLHEATVGARPRLVGGLLLGGFPARLAGAGRVRVPRTPGWTLWWRGGEHRDCPRTAINWGQWSDVGVARALTLDCARPHQSRGGHRGAGGAAGPQRRPGRVSPGCGWTARRRRSPRSAKSAISQAWSGSWTQRTRRATGRGPMRFASWTPSEVSRGRHRAAAQHASRRSWATPTIVGDRVGPAADRAGHGFPDGRANPEHRAR